MRNVKSLRSLKNSFSNGVNHKRRQYKTKQALVKALEKCEAKQLKEFGKLRKVHICQNKENDFWYVILVMGGTVNQACQASHFRYLGFCATSTRDAFAY